MPGCCSLGGGGRETSAARAGPGRGVETLSTGGNEIRIFPSQEVDFENLCGTTTEIVHRKRKDQVPALLMQVTAAPFIQGN